MNEEIKNIIKLNRLAAWVLSLVMLTFAIVLAVKADYGISVATSATYILSLRINAVSFGTFNYIHQGLVFMLMLLIIREVKLQYFFSFLTAVIFGYMLDFSGFLLRGYNPSSYIERLIIFISSMVLMSCSVAIFISSGLPLLPFDTFVRKVSEKFNISFGRLKLVFDLSNLTIAVTLSLLFFQKLVAVSWGTFVFGIALGPSIGLFLKLNSRFIEITGLLPDFIAEKT